MTYLVLVIASFIAAFISGAAGFGGALLLLPVVTLYVGAEAAVPILTIAQLIGNSSRMAFGFSEIKWKPVGIFLVGALPLSVLGAFGFSSLPKDIITRCIGFVLIIIVLMSATKIIELKSGNKTLLIGGCFVGLISGLAGSAGPIGAAVFLSLGLTPVAYVATEASTAVAMHLVKTVVYGRLLDIEISMVLTGLMMGAAMILGTFCANRIIKKMSKDKFQKYVGLMLLIVGLYMLIFGA